jgi:anti-anti-sigma factor
MLTSSLTRPLQISSFNDASLIQLPAMLTFEQSVGLQQTIHTLCQQSQPPQKIILDFAQTVFIDSSGVGALNSILKMLKQHQIHLVCWSVSEHVKAVLALSEFNQFLAGVSGTEAIAPTLYQIVNPPASRFELSQMVHPSVNSKVKRLMDIVGGSVGLIVTAILFLPIAIAIRLDSPGPIFYRQTRCSWMGKRFKIWKFRSMVSDADQLKHQVRNQASGAFFKNTHDPRVTRVGRFLRKTSLDELPQFWHVLKGEMSLVGTRPPTVDEVEQYDIAHWQRLNVKPGLTGEWQVNGRSQVKDFEEVVKMDLAYQKNWTIWYDLLLVFKTIMILFSKRSGAV